MRSRYAAYALGLSEYIMDSTHRSSPHHREDRDAWRADIDRFAAAGRFASLRILSHGTDARGGWVHFHAGVLLDTPEGGVQDRSFEEHSRFRREGDRWFYVAAESVLPG